MWQYRDEESRRQGIVFVFVLWTTLGALNLVMPDVPLLPGASVDLTAVAMRTSCSGLLAILAAHSAMSLRSLVLNFRAGANSDPISIARRWRLFLAFFVPVALVLLAWWAGEWPGHWKTDEAYLYQQAVQGQAEPWLSTAYSIYAITVLRTLGNYTVISLVNCVVIAAVIADVLSLLVFAGLKRWIAVVLLVLACTSVPLGLLATSLSHDILSATLKLCLVALVTRCVVRRAVSPRGVMPTSVLQHAFLLTLFAVALRGENIVLVLVVPLILVLTRAIRPVQALALCVVLIAGAWLFKGPLSRDLARPNPDRENRYTLTLVINPLSYYLANNYWSPTPDADRAVLAKVVDLDELARYHTPYDIQTYWIGASHGDVTKDEMRDVKRLFVRATLDNPGLFLSSRVATVSGMLGMTPRSNLWFYDHREQRPLDQYAASNPPMQRAFDDGYVWSERPGLIARCAHAARDWSAPRGWTSPGQWIWNAWPALLIMIGALASARRTPRTALVACVIAGPFALVALAGPASHFKYIYDLYAVGFLLPALWVWERSLRVKRWTPPATGRA